MPFDQNILGVCGVSSMNQHSTAYLDCVESANQR
jgi:hypothetical protein